MYALRLSDKGTSTIQDAAPAVAMTDERLLSALPVKERDAFIKGLERMVAELTSHADATGANSAE